MVWSLPAHSFAPDTDNPDPLTATENQLPFLKCSWLDSDSTSSFLSGSLTEQAVSVIRPCCHTDRQPLTLWPSSIQLRDTAHLFFLHLLMDVCLQLRVTTNEDAMGMSLILLDKDLRAGFLGHTINEYFDFIRNRPCFATWLNQSTQIFTVWQEAISCVSRAGKSKQKLTVVFWLAVSEIIRPPAPGPHHMLLCLPSILSLSCFF